MSQLPLPMASDAAGPPRARQPRDDELAKPVEAALLRPIRGKCTLLTRRGFNSLLLNAQRMPPSKDGYFSMPLNQLVNEHGSYTRNIEATKHLVANMLATVVAWGDSAAALAGRAGTRWEACALLAYARIERTSQNRLTLTYDFHKELRERLLAPEVYYRLSLAAAANFRTHAALVLFEIASRYATNRNGLSARKPWREWAAMLTGTSDLADTVQYKYFKRDTLAPAIRDVNQATVGLAVELLEHTQGRRVMDLQLKISITNKKGAEDPAQFCSDAELLADLAQLAVEPDDAEDLAQAYGVGELRAGCQILRARLLDQRLEPLQRPAAFLRRVLQNRAAAADRPPATAEPDGSAAPVPLAVELHEETPSALALRREWAAHARAIEVARFDSLLPEEKWAELSEFRQSHEFARLNSEDAPFQSAWKTLVSTWPAQASAMHGYISRRFFAWLARRNWPEPADDADLLPGVRQLAARAGQLGPRP